MRSWVRRSIYWPFLACLKGVAQIVPSLQLFKSNISILFYWKNYETIFSSMQAPMRIGIYKNIGIIWCFFLFLIFAQDRGIGGNLLTVSGMLKDGRPNRTRMTTVLQVYLYFFIFRKLWNNFFLNADAISNPIMQK